ncbi:MAG: right-handed parallel beta-helix repeat-containing protein [Thermodesulfobacteriota bacterium]
MRFADLFWTPIIWLISALAWISRPIRRLKLRRTILFLILALALAVMPNSPAWATIWHCIPYTSGGGSGTELDPWNGFASIVWGAGGVIAGDTLYVRGTHWDSTNNDHKIVVNANGSAGSPITIRGDWPGGPGYIVISAGKWPHASWVPEGTYDHHYKQTFSGGTAYFAIPEQINGGLPRSLRKYTGAPDGTWEKGSFSMVAGTPNTLYYYPSDAPNEGTITDGNHLTYKDNAGASGQTTTAYSYVTFMNLSFFCNVSSAYGAIHIPDGSTNITASNVRFEGQNFTLRGVGDTTDVTVSGCTFYRIGQGPMNALGAATRWTVENCTVEDLDMTTQWASTDNEAISFQTAIDCVVSGNTVSGSSRTGIIFYQGADTAMHGNRISRNFVYNCGVDCIKLGGNNAQTVFTWAYDNIVEYNIVTTCVEQGIDVKSYKPVGYDAAWSAFNNVIYGAASGFLVDENWGGDPAFVFKNNIVRNCSKNINWSNLSKTEVYVKCDNNLWDESKNWTFGATTYTVWADYKSGTGEDANSPTPADPVFLNATGSYSAATDFQIKSASPAKNHGDNSVWSGQASIIDYAGATITDAEGNIVAKGGIVDLGAYEMTKAAGKIMIVQ